MSDSTDPNVTILAALARLEAGQAELRTEFSTMRTEFTTMRTDVTTLRTDLTAVRTEATATRTAIMDRIDRLQDSVTQIRDDIAVNMGGVEAMQRANDNTRELVRLHDDQLSRMWRQIKAVQASVRELRGEA